MIHFRQYMELPLYEEHNGQSYGRPRYLRFATRSRTVILKCREQRLHKLAPSIRPTQGSF